VSGWPQPLLTVPHWTPSEAQVAGEQVTQVWVVGSQLFPWGQFPQSMSWPQLLSTTPHVAMSCAQVLPGTAHCFVVESQTWVASHVPHWSVPPHWSEYVPQAAPSEAQLTQNEGPPPVPPVPAALPVADPVLVVAVPPPWPPVPAVTPFPLPQAPASAAEETMTRRGAQ
jgi:hypothetical protein